MADDGETPSYQVDVPYDRDELAPDWRQGWVGRRRGRQEGPGFRMSVRGNANLPDWQGREPPPQFPLEGDTSYGDAPRWQGMTMDDQRPTPRGAVPPARDQPSRPAGAVQRAYAYRALNQERDRAQEPDPEDPESPTGPGALQRFAQGATMLGEGAAARGDAAYRSVNHAIRNAPDASELLRGAVEPHYYHDISTASQDAYRRGDYPAWFTYAAMAPVGMAADITGMAAVGRMAGPAVNAGVRGIQRGVNRLLEPLIPHGWGYPAAVSPTFALPAARASGLMPGPGGNSPDD